MIFTFSGESPAGPRLCQERSVGKSYKQTQSHQLSAFGSGGFPFFFSFLLKAVLIALNKYSLKWLNLGRRERTRRLLKQRRKSLPDSVTSVEINIYISQSILINH